MSNEKPSAERKQAEGSEKIAKLNDLLRKFGIGGQVLVTIGIQGLEESTRYKVFTAIRNFDDLDTPNNRPNF